MPTYNYVITSLRRLDLAAMYICNVNLFWFFPSSPPLPTETAAFSSVLSKGVHRFPSSIPKRKKEKKGKKKCIVSCRVVSLTLELGIVLNACRRYDEEKKKK